jgi:hypothetical protein
MMEDELERFEADLGRTAPAPAPPHLMEQLRIATGPRPPERQAPRPRFGWKPWLIGWRGLAVAAPAVAAIVFCLTPHPAVEPVKINNSNLPATEPNAVQVGYSLVASFDAVAQVPGAEPVRFRCREWQDDVVIHDDAHGMVISRSTPRIEMIPVRFETY